MDAQTLSQTLSGLDLVGRLAALSRLVSGRLTFTTSFGLEDQAILHAIAESNARVTVATLDTGRLFQETYEVWAASQARYGVAIAAFAPRTEDVEALVAAQGPQGFRASVEARKACCGVRKVEPLRRALAGASGWITGLRAEQSAHRAATPLAEVDAAFGLLKINPLADWTRREVADYVAARGAPYNALHDRGYPSIGCAPCTRAVAPGEPERAGRWWWEDEARKECGLHVAADGRLVRSAAPVAEAAR
ncbi:phosphoadenylyl-sulfate reductase [Alsobacter sp. KACC 23698]|uniref:Adenosine 5'-phosphosulfate reductase n=1 Tax=Alsobacter sp. KACC 23698 TaxID=3149229 RepID=A0AAU7JCM3_9HYPH